MILSLRATLLRPASIGRRAAATIITSLVVCIVAAVAQANPPAVAPKSVPAAMASGDIILLDFSATWCGPCRSMAPLIGEIAAAGWIVRHVDVDAEGDLVRRFGVTGVPCYVLLVKGNEVGRINGATTQGELEKLLAKSRVATGNVAESLADNTATPLPPVADSPRIPGIPLPSTTRDVPLSTEPPVVPHPFVPALVSQQKGTAKSGSNSGSQTQTTTMDSLDTSHALVQSQATSSENFASRASAESAGDLPLAGPAKAALEERLIISTARLRVNDAEGVSWGTGTVVDCRQGEALILTCGHIFRDSKGKGRIEVDLFGPGAPKGLAGQVVSWDLKRDLALVSIFTDEKLKPARVGGQNRTTTPGEPVATVGCNGGKEPTVNHSQVTAVDKYLGPANVQVAGQPVQGRSGGGLFAIDGTLIGVCNAADPTDNEGLFAALPTIHEQLDEVGLAFVYRSAYPSGSVADAVAGTVPGMPAEMPPVSFDRRDRADAVPTASIDAHPVADDIAASTGSPPPEALSTGERALLDHVRQQAGKAEVICIVRPHGAPQNASEVFVLQGASHDFVSHISKTHAVGASKSQEHSPLPAASGRSDLALLPATNLVR